MELPDTPNWSHWRRGTITGVLLVGALMILGGYISGRLGVSEQVALRLIDNGSDVLIWAAATIVAGASLERAAAWVPRRPVTTVTKE